mgnify:CR=1 FL=1
MSTKLVEQLNIKTPSIKHPVKELSGGNIQKILLGRELAINPHLLVTAYPTRGLDIASSHLIYDLINERKTQGTGILYVGEDLDVLLELYSYPPLALAPTTLAITPETLASTLALLEELLVL